MKWKYSSKYWKHSTDIFRRNQKFLSYKKGYVKNFRKYYNISRTEILHRRIYRDFINILLEEVTDGNIVSLNKGVTFHLKEKDVYVNPYDDIYEKLRADGKMLYIYMNTGEFITKNKTFMVIPSKGLRDKLLKIKGLGKSYTKLLGKFYNGWD